MKQDAYTITDNRRITPSLWSLTLAGDTSAITAPGQFLNIKIPGFFLRRPISISQWGPGTVTVIYKPVGAGTDAMTAMRPGTVLDVLTGLGNGFDVGVSGARPLIVGGGVGIAPLVRLARELALRGTRPTAVLGYATQADIFAAEDIGDVSRDVIICTEDGSRGIKGFVTDGVRGAGDYTHVYACGPTAMLRALDAAVAGPGQFSLEERMGCGFGACMGCTIQTESGPKRVCKDGPVFPREEIRW